MILKKLTQDEADTLQAPLELDLLAFYKTLQDDIMDEISEDMTLESIIDNIGNLI